LSQRILSILFYDKNVGEKEPEQQPEQQQEEKQTNVWDRHIARMEALQQEEENKKN